MSISKPRPTAARNPATMFIEWKGGEDQGYFQHFDKQANDGKGENIKVDLSNGFIVIEKDLMSITGYDDSVKNGITSNEIYKGSDQKLIVRLWNKGKAETLMEGTYEELKERISQDRRLHYTQCIYAVIKGKLVHIKLTGSCLTSWFEDISAKEKNAWVIHVDTKDGKKGNVKYKMPVFAYGTELTQLEFDAACEIDSTILQPYLEVYLQAKGAIPKDELPEETVSTTIDVSKWREQASPISKELLCEHSIKDLRELSDSLDPNDTFQDYIGAGIAAHNEAAKTWPDKGDKSGKLLKDYTLAELQQTLETVKIKAPLNPARQYLEEGIIAKKIEAEVESAKHKASEAVVDIPTEADDSDLPF